MNESLQSASSGHGYHEVLAGGIDLSDDSSVGYLSWAEHESLSKAFPDIKKDLLRFTQ